jgi:glutamate racemase
VFDSGVGGLTVVRALRRQLPAEDIIYLGDLARLPYGDKSAETVRRYSLENAQFLCQQQVKLVVVACHTATAWSLQLLQERLDVPVVGVIQPAIESALAVARKAIGVIATRGTISSGVFQERLKQYHPVQAIACPLFVPLVEEGLLDHAATRDIVRHYLEPLQQVDTLLLGCTHYPLLSATIAQLMGDVQLIDPAISCAQAVARLLTELGQQNGGASKGTVRLYTTDRPPHLNQLIERFLGEPISAELI